MPRSGIVESSEGLDRILQSFRACLTRLSPEFSNIKGVAEMQQRFGSRVDFLEQRFESLGIYMDKTLMRLRMAQDAVSLNLSFIRASNS